MSDHTIDYSVLATHREREPVHCYAHKTQDGRYFAVSLTQNGFTRPSVSEPFATFQELQAHMRTVYSNRVWHRVEPTSL